MHRVKSVCQQPLAFADVEGLSTQSLTNPGGFNTEPSAQHHSEPPEERVEEQGDLGSHVKSIKQL